MKEIIANWRIELNVECPKCNDYFDIYYRHFIEGIPQPGHIANNCEFYVTCPNCGKDFIVTKVEH